MGEALQAGLAAGGNRARRHFCYHKVVELQSSARARRTGFRGESRQTQARLSGSLSHSHSVCVSTRETSRIRGIKTATSFTTDGVTLLDTWRAMESLVDRGRCRAIGLSDISLNELLPIYESARIKPAVVQVEVPSVSAGNGASGILQEDKGIVFLAFAPLGHGMRPGPARRSSHFGNRRTSWKDAGTGAAGLGSAAWHGFAHHTQDCGPRAERISTSPLFRKTRLTKSIAFRPDRGSMK